MSGQDDRTRFQPANDGGRRGRDPKVGQSPKAASKEELDKELQEGLKSTFPASDPVAVSQTTTSGRPAGRTNQKPPRRTPGKTNQKPPQKPD